MIEGRTKIDQIFNQEVEVESHDEFLENSFGKNQRFDSSKVGKHGDHTE